MASFALQGPSRTSSLGFYLELFLAWLSEKLLGLTPGALNTPWDLPHSIPRKYKSWCLDKKKRGIFGYRQIQSEEGYLKPESEFQGIRPQAKEC